MTEIERMNVSSSSVTVDGKQYITKINNRSITNIIKAWCTNAYYN